MTLSWSKTNYGINGNNRDEVRTMNRGLDTIWIKYSLATAKIITTADCELDGL